jgi:hypothetical protein
MASDLWDRGETAGNADPWAASANALAPNRRYTLVPVDHDPWAPIQSASTLNDGGNLSGSTARRLPGERAVAPRGAAVMPDYPQEDVEARAWAPRTGFEHIPFGNAAVGLAGIPVVANRSAVKAVRETGEAIERLMTRGYTPGQEDEQAVADAFTAGGVAAGGAFPVGRPTGSLGTFIGRRGAQNLAEAGKPTALKAIEMAERMEARGVSEPNIRQATNALIETEDASLGGVHKGDDGMWRVELDDSKSKLRPIGPGQSKLGRELTHPDLYKAYPDMPAVDYRRVSGGTSYHKPGYPNSEIGVGERAPHKRASTMHEVQHEGQMIEDFARGGSHLDFQPGGPLEHLKLPGETPRQAYRRISGEHEAAIVSERLQMAPRTRRAIHPDKTRQELTTTGVVRDGPRIIRQGENPMSMSSGRRSDEPGPSAFEQAQEKGWEDLAQKGVVGQQSMWSEMGAHLNKPGQRGGGPGKPPSELWSRETNLVLAQMHKRGEWPSEIAIKMSDRFGRRYTEEHIALQLEALGLVGSNRKLPSSAVGEWQPDAVAILRSNRVKGMSAAQIAKLIEEETGQITTKNSVIGKLNRLRQERQRTELAVDLAKAGMELKSSGAPIFNENGERRRKDMPPRGRMSLWDRIIFFGGY